MVRNRHDKAQSVALVEETLDSVPFPPFVKVEHLGDGRKLDISEEVFALLNDSDSKRLLNERSVLLKVGHDFDGLTKCLTSLLRDLERRLFELDQLEQSGHIGVSNHIMDVLRVDCMHKARVRRNALNLQHFADFQDSLGHSL